MEPISYLTVLQTKYPNVQFIYRSLDPNSYSSIVWLNQIIIPQSQLDQDISNYYKTKRIEELSLETRANIEKGFISNALGYDRWYDGFVEDQLNIAGATVAAEKMGYFLFPCRDPITMEKDYISHTHEQMLQVSSDGALFKLSLLKRFNDVKTYILNNSLTFEELKNTQV